MCAGAAFGGESGLQTVGESGDRPVGFLLTTHDLGAPEGRNMGAAGYSYEFVLRAIRPLLEKLGTVVRVPNTARDLAEAVRAFKDRGLVPVHLGFLPYQDFLFVPGVAHVVMPMWEFPDVPREAWKGNRQYNWPETANRADLSLVSGPFLEGALRRAGVTKPLRIVPVPVPDGYFDIPPWDPAETTRLECPAYVFGPCEEAVAQSGKPGSATGLWEGARWTASTAMAWTLGRRRYDHLARAVKRWMRKRVLPYPLANGLTLSGVVYTSVLNPNDRRKNWQGLIRAFLTALGDQPDATLVLKLATDDMGCVRHVIHTYQAMGPHRCAVVFICDYLGEETMLRLCRATTFYAHATRAEGSCLPLMNHMAAGRPAISPVHSAIADYFGKESGFVVESVQEAAGWPHESRFRARTTWARIDIDSLARAFADSHAMARHRPEDHAGLAGRGREAIRAWAGRQAVMARLTEALGELGLSRR